MGVLCHPNASDEKANGVGVSTDPIYNTSNTFYLNSQIGEDLITNPDNTSIPEEILLDRVRVSENDFILIQHSNLVASDSMIMNPYYLNQMRDYLTVIHDEFALLYQAQDNDKFAMEIEYKITSDDRLFIKQARPWVVYVLGQDEEEVGQDSLRLKIFPNPAHDYINVRCDSCQLESLYITDIMGRLIQKIVLSPASDLNMEIYIFHLPPGMYLVNGISISDKASYTEKFIRH
jgi:hypothetical protein